MRTIVRWSVSAATILLFALPAIAQVQYRLEFYGGVTIPKDKDFEIGFPQFPVLLPDFTELHVPVPGSGRLVGNLDPVRGSYTHDFSPGAHGGIRIGVDSKGHFGQDIDYSYGTYASKIVNRASGESLFSFTPRVHQISWNAIWYPGGQSEGKVFPYLTVGVGGTVNSLSQRTATATFPLALEESLNRHLRTDNTFTFNTGFGARFRLNKRYGVRVDVRDYMSRALRYGFLKFPHEPLPLIIDPDTGKVLQEPTTFESPLPIGGLFHRITASVGFVYYF